MRPRGRTGFWDSGSRAHMRQRGASAASWPGGATAAAPRAPSSHCDLSHVPRRRSARHLTRCCFVAGQRSAAANRLVQHAAATACETGRLGLARAAVDGARGQHESPCECIVLSVCTPQVRSICTLGRSAGWRGGLGWDGAMMMCLGCPGSHARGQPTCEMPFFLRVLAGVGEALLAGWLAGGLDVSARRCACSAGGGVGLSLSGRPLSVSAMATTSSQVCSKKRIRSTEQPAHTDGAVVALRSGGLLQRAASTCTAPEPMSPRSSAEAEGRNPGPAPSAQSRPLPRDGSPARRPAFPAERRLALFAASACTRTTALAAD